MLTGADGAATIRRAKPEDRERIEQLLVESDLPTVGVADALGGFFVAEHAGALAGVVGVEDCGDYGLLRSTAVAPAWRGRGLGRQLVECAIAESESKGMSALYLLTTTAERYFPGFGFSTTTRDVVPAALRETEEFQGACPASATVMVRELVRRNPAR
jgi:amino-acid N-acetyltransferase